MAWRFARDVLTLTRPHQWYKNLLLFIGLVFSHRLFELDAVALATGAFLVFCVASSGVYALNDVLDAKRDRLHPRKQDRPVASGRIGRFAIVLGFGLIALALAGAWTLGRPFFITLVAYLVLQGGYFASFKHTLFLDLFSLAGGLVLRAVAGVVVLAVSLSPWLLLCTFFLALFLGLGKRRAELRTLGPEAANHRRSLADYSQPLLEQATSVITAALLVSYSLYAFFHEERLMMLTIPFALYGLFRYLFLVGERGMGGEPEQLFGDVASLVNLVLWAVMVVLVLYVDVPWAAWIAPPTAAPSSA